MGGNGSRAARQRRRDVALKLAAEGVPETEISAIIDVMREAHQRLVAHPVEVVGCPVAPEVVPSETVALVRAARDVRADDTSGNWERLSFALEPFAEVR